MASITSPNWKPVGCHETVLDGGFFSNITRARKHFLAQGWEIIDGEWWCPACARQMRE